MVDVFIGVHFCKNTSQFRNSKIVSDQNHLLNADTVTENLTLLKSQRYNKKSCVFTFLVKKQIYTRGTNIWIKIRKDLTIKWINQGPLVATSDNRPQASILLYPPVYDFIKRACPNTWQWHYGHTCVSPDFVWWPVWRVGFG